MPPEVHESPSQAAVRERAPRQAAAPAVSGTRMIGVGLVSIGILLILVFGFDWGIFAGNAPAADPPRGITIGQKAPEFETVNLDGAEIALSDLEGKFVLLNFWATWCSPCRIEMPFLQAQHEQHRDDLAIVGVDFDEPPDLVAEFVEEYGLTFEIALDPGGFIQELYEIRGYPTSYFLDREGVIRSVHIGVMSQSQLDGYLSDLGLD
jgi:peroxiredoxin